ncbi:MAG: DUF1858 domain-containing protein [Thermoanaerobaculia bacterium]
MTTQTKRFSEEMTVGEALVLDGRAKWVLAAYHIAGCSQCPTSEEETLAQLAKGYGIELGKLLDDLNSLDGRLNEEFRMKNFE